MDKYGIIGYPLKHSFSYKYFGEKFNRENIDAVYNNYEIETIEQLPNIIKEESQLRGLNVTIPYKEKVIPFLNEMDATAAYVGAVNVIKVKEINNRKILKGYNTDLIGFRESIKPLLNSSVHKKALILGTGGASKAVKYGLENLKIETKYVSRTGKNGILAYDDLTKEIIEEYLIIINASPVGTYPDVNNAPAIPYEFLTANHILYDLVYNPPLTKFCELGIKAGCMVKNGKEMLELQAQAAWKIWNEQS